MSIIFPPIPALTTYKRDATPPSVPAPDGVWYALPFATGAGVRSAVSFGALEVVCEKIGARYHFRAWNDLTLTYDSRWDYRGFGTPPEVRAAAMAWAQRRVGQ